jgi:FkbM family methyltransferase
MKVNYFDLGSCEGVELLWMAGQILPSLKVENFSIYGFEASKPYADGLKSRFKLNPNITICHKAISDTEEEIRLYHASNGLGHSIFSTKNNVSKDRFERVESIRFSKWIEENNIDLESSFNIMKVNIEGAEWHLFRDLIENDLVKHFDIFCGAGHDIEKIEELSPHVEEYYSLLEENNIQTHRFSEWKPERNADIRQLILDTLPLKWSGNIEDIEVSPNHREIWEGVALPVQERKAHNHNLPTERALRCFDELSKRPSYLCNIARLNGVKNIVEVGTAQGLQFFSFAEYVKEAKNDGHVWSCDIVDVRNKEYSEKYKEYTTFFLGNSEKLSSVLEEAEAKIDLFYIDGAHDKGDVVRDVYHLRKHQSEDPIWIFDDFDDRFGCYEDISALVKINPKFRAYRVGDAASGNPNHQVIIFGRL